MNQSNGNNHRGHGKHMLWMAVCCIVPMLIIFLLPGSGIARMLSPLILLICPLAHILMIGGLMKSCRKEANQPHSHSDSVNQ